MRQTECEGCLHYAGDVPGQPVLLFTLRGTFDPVTRAVIIIKEYQRPVPEHLKVIYEGTLTWPASAGGRPTLTGRWKNETEGSLGRFHCVLQD